MLSALGHVLPIAVAVALSTVPVMATILVLLSPGRTLAAVPLATGWVVGLAAVSVGALLSGRNLLPPAGHPRAHVGGSVELVIGVTLVVLGIFSWRRAGHVRPVGRPGLLDRVGSLGPWACFALGFALNLRPKGLILGVAAGLAVAEGGGGPASDVIVLAVYLVLSASTVVVPVVLTLVAPARAQPLLAAARDWLTANRGVLTGLVLLLVGVVIVGAGLGRL